MIKEKFYDFINESLYSLIRYIVTYHTDTSSEVIYTGYDYEYARNEFETFTLSHSEMVKCGSSFVLFEKVKENYKFIGDEDESPEENPIDEYNIDEYYELEEEEEWEEIDSRDLIKKNETSDDLLNEVETHFKEIYGNYKYNTINVYDDEDEFVGTIQLRISDHSENPRNLKKFSSHNAYISVVIADIDDTDNRFKYKPRPRNSEQLYFSSSDTKEHIVDEIEAKIHEFKEEILIINT